MMDKETLKKEIIKRANGINPQQKVVEYISNLDFKDSEIKQQAKDICRQIFSKIGKNESLSSLEAKTLHCLITKIHLSDISLDNFKFQYINKETALTKFNSKADALYDPVSDTIYFIEERSVYNIIKEQPNKKFRFQDVGFTLSVICHECQHIIQDRQYEGKNLDELTPMGYIIDKQAASRRIKSLKYGHNVLYRDNHDQFYIEMDANEVGYREKLKLLKELAPEEIYKENESSTTYAINELAKAKREYERITWWHKTNPDNGRVSANHIASMIIDEGIQPKYLKEYPSLHLTYKPDCTKKTLEEVEREREEIINKILKEGTSEKIKKEVPRITEIYETAIESDPILSFERCMRQIATLSIDATRPYIGYKGITEEKYVYPKARRELDAAVKKAAKLCKYIGERYYKVVNEIFNKCNRYIEISKPKDQRGLEFKHTKQIAILGIKSAIYKNRDFEEPRKKEKEAKENGKIKKEEEKIKKAKAKEIINKVFPNFNPQLKTGLLSNGRVIVENNVKEKLLLDESARQYQKDFFDYMSKNKNKIPEVSPWELYKAIDNFYDNFSITQEYEEKFKLELKNATIKPLENVLTEDLMKEERAKEIIKKVFPNFNPQSKTGLLSNQRVIVENNVKEKFLIIESARKYDGDYQNYIKTIKKEPEVTPSKLFEAIKIFYNFPITLEQREKLKSELNNGKIELLKNVYTDKLDSQQKQEFVTQKTNSNGTVRQDSTQIKSSEVNNSKNTRRM